MVMSKIGDHTNVKYFLGLGTPPSFYLLFSINRDPKQHPSNIQNFIVHLSASGTVL